MNTGVRENAESAENLAERIAGLSPEKRALLGARLKKTTTTSHGQAIIPGNSNGSVPLSLAQERFWFFDQMEPGSPVYNRPTNIRLTGTLDVEALEQSLNEIVRRHDVLRTTIAVEQGQPIQNISPFRPVTLPLVDLSALPEGGAAAEARRLATEAAQRPFDLVQGPLFRTMLLKLRREDHLLLLNVHHIIFDGWSAGVLLSELAALYQSFTTDTPSPLSELPIQYRHFAQWQRQWLQGEISEKQLAYWKRQLEGLPRLELPTDRPPLAFQTFQVARKSLLLSPALTETLKALSRREEITLYMTLLAAVSTLLHRYIGHDDIVVGSPIAGRTRVESERLIGLFINTLVLRTSLSGNPTFRELFGRVRQVSLAAYAHQDLPLQHLVAALHPQRGSTRTPLFQVLFNLQNAPMPLLELPGVTLSPAPSDSETSTLDLTIEFTETPKGLSGFFEYNKHLFDEATITRMAGHFQTLLEAIVADPDQRISDLPLLTESERHQLLVEWNDTRTDSASEACVHQVFEAHVERSPDAIAVISEEQQMTYRELNARSNQLAHYLRALGVGPEVPVGIYVDRSLEMIVALLGVLKSGGAYVPLNLAYPKERLAIMLEDARVPVILTKQRLAPGLPEHGAQIVSLDTEWEAIARRSEQNPGSCVTPENLAYVIYTSGTTGNPKGVMIQHRSLTNYAENMGAVYSLEAGDRVLQFSAISFDASVEEIFCCLARGSTLGLRNDAMLESISVFLQKCHDWEITVLGLPTAYWHELTARIDEQALSIPPSLRLVILGGERALPGHVATWHKNVGQGVGLVNTYGPTEATIGATMCELSGPARIAFTSRDVPIGCPIPNLQTYILDRYLRPVPIGVPGDLHIGGVGLARGYLNRPELTAEKFIPNPFNDEPGTRLYKTGDLARYRPDGNIEYLGRFDHQVKIRGFRVELGEIEAALNQHPLVRETVVTVHEDRPGEKRLVAYVVPDQDRVPTASELRSSLMKRLPEYMVPSVFVLLDALPLTVQGKIDRGALPAPDQAMPDPARAFVAPRDGLELELVGIWEKVLEVKPIGVRDDFFALGGHSLLAVRLFGQIEKRFGRNLPLATLFQAPTVEQLADILRREGWSAPWSSLVAIQPGGSKPPFYCVHGHGGDVLFCADLARSLGLDQPFYALRAQGLDGKQPAHTRVEDMAAHYIKEIRAFQPEGPYFLGGYCFGSLVAFEMAQQLLSQDQKVALLALIERYAPGHHDELPDSIWHRAYSFVRRYKNHLASFSLLETKDKSAYVLGGVRRIATRLKRKTRERIDKIVSINYGALGLPVPRANGQVQRINRPPISPYQPRIYPGRAIVFRASQQPAGVEPDPALGWRRWIAGSLDVYEVPGYYNTMLSEPRVRVLGEQLRSCLDRTQATESSKQA